MVNQDKFIPIVFGRNENGEVCKPTYLKEHLHFDFSIDDTYNSEYLRLVKTLYGEAVYPKPELGNKPAWVDKTTSIEIKKKSSFDAIKTIFPEKAKQGLFSEYISEQLGKIKKCIDLKESVGDTEEVLNFYNRFGEIRTEFLALLEYSMYIDSPEKIITKELEKCALEIQDDSSVAGGLSKSFLHELFLYSVAYFLKNDDYSSAGYILGRTYYNPNKIANKISGYNLFYSRSDNSLDRAMNERDDKNYVSGCTEYWIENIEAKYYTKE